MSTPNMGLELPSVNVTPGPLWATELNAAFDVVDAHDHTPGNGLPIGPAAIDIDANLSFKGYAATDLARVVLSALTSATTTPLSLSSAGGDLWYTNASGVTVQLTNGASPAGGVGSITGLVAPASASWNSGAGAFEWNSNATTRAAMDVGGVLLRQGGSSTAQAVTISAPAAGVTSWNLKTPPAAPVSSNGFFTATTAGDGAWWYLDGTTLTQAGGTMSVGAVPPAKITPASVVSVFPIPATSNQTTPLLIINNALTVGAGWASALFQPDGDNQPSQFKAVNSSGSAGTATLDFELSGAVVTTAAHKLVFDIPANSTVNLPLPFVRFLGSNITGGSVTLKIYLTVSSTSITVTYSNIAVIFSQGAW